VRAGRVSISETLAMAPQLARDPSRHIVARAARIVGAIQDDLVTEAERPSYARFVRGLFAERARSLGLTARTGEDEDTKFLREDLVPLVADAGEDAQLRAEARKLAGSWLEDRKAIDTDMVSPVLRLAALDGDRALFDRFLAEAGKNADRRDRRRILGAVGSFRDPALAKAALELTLGDEFDIRESSRILATVLDDPATRELGWDFVKKHFDALAGRMPSETRARLFASGSKFCDDAHRDDAEKFFRERTGQFPGAPRTLDQALETVTLCAAQRSLQGPDVGRFLAAY
jgi:alanyl aminopeptidase